MEEEDVTAPGQQQSLRDVLVGLAKKLALTDRTLAAQIREVFDDIVQLQKQGVSLSTIALELNQAGFSIQLGTLKTIMTRIRRERKEKEMTRATASPQQQSAAPTRPDAPKTFVRAQVDEKEIF